MQNHTDMKSECQQEKALIEAEQSRLRRHIRWVSTLRVVLFLTALLSISFYIAGQKFILLPIVSEVGLVLFLALVKYHTSLRTADILDDQLIFAYRLRPGIAQNMNACFLMQQMGIGEGKW